METKKFIDLMRKYTFARLRVVNIKLWGDKRVGLFREFTADDTIALIEDFKRFSANLASQSQTDSRSETNQSTEKESFRTGSNYAILSRLCEQYYIYEGSEKLQKKIIAEVEEIINELRYDNGANTEFEGLLNNRQNNIMHRFRAEHPSLKEKDYRLYTYLAAGLSATTIAVLLGKEKSVVYNRISRLKKVIKEEFRQ